MLTRRKGGIQIFFIVSLFACAFLFAGCPAPDPGTDPDPEPDEPKPDISPVCAFYAAPTTGDAPLTVRFFQQSTPGSSPITSYEWDFGDGTTSTDASPTHIYAESDKYTVSLTITTAIGTDSETKAEYITVKAAAPKAAFEVSSRTGTIPLSASFTDKSTAGTAPITDWLWSFGDGNTSTEQNPTHVYGEVGTFSVALTVRTAFGTSTETKTALITTVGTPTAAFSATPLSGASPLPVQFADESVPGTYPIETWAWDFGDGTTSSAQSPSHVYAQAGSYTVSLTVTTVAHTSTETKEGLITVGDSPKADFTATPTSGALPLSVKFTDLSGPGDAPITQWLWRFGDGQTSTERTPTHIYTTPGNHTVTLTVTTAVSTDTCTKTSLVSTTLVPPTVAFSATPRLGVLPNVTIAFESVIEAGSFPVSSYLWDFGDGESSTEAEPTHEYNASGNFDVSLTVMTGDGRSYTASYANYVQAAAEVTSRLAKSTATFLDPITTERVYLSGGQAMTVAKNELLIACQPDITAARLAALIAGLDSLNAKVVGEDAQLRMLQVRIPDNASEPTLMETINGFMGVLGVWPNMVGALDQDPETEMQMRMYAEYLAERESRKALSAATPEVMAESVETKKNPAVPSFPEDYWMDAINAYPAWSVSTGDESVLIGIVDSEFQPEYGLIDPDRIALYDACGVSKALPADKASDKATGIRHGTLVTALAAGDGSGSKAVGVAWKAKIAHFDITSQITEDDDIIFATSQLSGLKNAILKGSNVVCLAGGPGPIPAREANTEQIRLRHRMLWRELMTPAVDYARRNDTLIVFSAGNDGDGTDENYASAAFTVHNDNLFLPVGSRMRQTAWATHALIVGASSVSDSKSRQGYVVGMGAPTIGVGCAKGVCGTGTSLAAALATGAAGLLHSIDGKLGGSETKPLVLTTAFPEMPALGTLSALNLNGAVNAGVDYRYTPVSDAVSVQLDGSKSSVATRYVTVTMPNTWNMGLVDVVFVVDRSGSFYDDIATMKELADKLITDLSALSDNMQFGVASFADFPLKEFGGEEDVAYELNQAITSDREAVLEAINKLDDPMMGGYDGPESQLEAVYQAATGAGRDLNDDGDYKDKGEIEPSEMGWREEATCIIILFTDASFHDSDKESDYPGAGFDETIATLVERGIIVVGLDSGYTGGDMERLTEATGGQVFALGSDGAGMAEAILDGVSSSVKIETLTLDPNADIEGFVTRDDIELFEGVGRGDMLTFTLRFKNRLNPPIRDLTYEFPLFAVTSERKPIARIPIKVTVRRAR